MFKPYLLVLWDHLAMLIGALFATALIFNGIGWIYVAGYFMKQADIGQQAESLYYTLPCVAGAAVTMLPIAWTWTRLQRWSKRIRVTLQSQDL